MKASEPPSSSTAFFDARPAAAPTEPTPTEVTAPGDLVASTLAGLLRHSDGPVRSSTLKRAVLRKAPTFDEADQGFRGFGELLRHLASHGVVALGSNADTGDPEVTFPQGSTDENDAFSLLVGRPVRPPGPSPSKDSLRTASA